MKIIYTHSDRNCGARQIDFLLFELFGGEFNKKYGCDPRPNVRCRLRLLDSIEKMRKLLTSNKEADIHCDSLMEDEDFHKHFKRSDLEDLIGPFLERFKTCVSESLARSGLKVEDLDFIELVGDATRMPKIQEILKDLYPGKELSRTLNSQETVARGCALQAAMLSPNFMVQNFEVQDFNLHQVQIQYKFSSQEGGSLKESDIFSIGSSYPSTKTITFANKLGALDLLLKYHDSSDILPGLPKQIAQYKIQEGKLDESKQLTKYSFVMRLSNNIHNICELEGAQLVQEWKEEQKIPVKRSAPAPAPPKPEEPKKEEKAEGAEPAADGEKADEKMPEASQPEPKKEEKAPEQEYEIKVRERKSYADIKYSTSSFALTPSIKRTFGDLEAKMFQQDMDILNLKAIKNDLEAYCYKMKDICGSYGSHEKYIDPAIKDGFLSEVGQCVDWIYGEGESASLQEYQDKLNKFQQIGQPVVNRQYYYSEIDQYFGQFQAQKDHIEKRTGEIEHLTDEQKTSISLKVQNANEFMGKVQADKAAKQPFEEPAYGIEGVIAHLSLLKSETEAIFNAPPPKKEEPPKNEPMSAEGKQEGEKPAGEAADAKPAEGEAEPKKDVDMNNEQ